MLEEADRRIANARTRVTRHSLAPGAHTGWHRHEYDYVVVPISGGRIRIVEGGKEAFGGSGERARLLSAGRRGARRVQRPRPGTDVRRSRAHRLSDSRQT